ncbi:hypothetical protein KC207_10355 [Phycicoccus sp. BSK3Z-2]|uniref:Uncharacterized protein n=1 Tax=Phycicoccus avicenniae TaxID=2828860 RepID=A0A941I098_9MICO|nr:hypothetical protein [Phycicoccus avicenniae]MBR7743690.1 hypothetical protein [Phycicoccus avicenniae]
MGRPDLAEYTRPLVTQVTDVTDRAADCPGAQHAERLPALARSIDRGARGDGVDFDDVDAFQTQGDAWLEALGYGPNHLPTG